MLNAEVMNAADQPKFKVRNAVNTGEMLVARLQPAVKKTPQGTQLE